MVPLLDLLCQRSARRCPRQENAVMFSDEAGRRGPLRPRLRNGVLLDLPGRTALTFPPGLCQLPCGTIRWVCLPQTLGPKKKKTNPVFSLSSFLPLKPSTSSDWIRFQMYSLLIDSVDHKPEICISSVRQEIKSSESQQQKWILGDWGGQEFIGRISTGHRTHEKLGR